MITFQYLAGKKAAEVNTARTVALSGDERKNIVEEYENINA